VRRIKARLGTASGPEPTILYISRIGLFDGRFYRDDFASQGILIQWGISPHAILHRVPQDQWPVRPVGGGLPSN